MKINVFSLVIFQNRAGSKKIEPGSKIMHVRDDSKKIEALHVWVSLVRFCAQLWDKTLRTIIRENFAYNYEIKPCPK